MRLKIAKETIRPALKFCHSPHLNSTERSEEMQATLEPIYGYPIWIPRRRYAYVLVVGANGQQSKEKREVFDADADYDFSEDDEAYEKAGLPPGGGGDDSSSTTSASNSDTEGSVEDAGAPLSAQSELAAPAAPAAAPSSMMSSAAIAEQHRLKAIHAQVRADPRSALEILKPENIGCDTCDDGTGESSTSRDDDKPTSKMCHQCVKEKKKRCKHIHLDIVVCKTPEKPCNKTTNTEPIVKAVAKKPPCDKQDIEVTKTYQAWAKSMSQFASVQAQNFAPSQAQSVSVAAKEKDDTHATLLAAMERANSLIGEFTAKRGLARMINEDSERSTLEKLSSAIQAGLRASPSAEPFKGVFEHAYVAMPVTVAAIGKIIPDEHVQKLFIGVFGAASKGKNGPEYRIGLAVKPDGAPKGTEKNARDVFRIKFVDGKMKAELLSAGMQQLQDQIAVKAAREAIGKIGSLLKKITDQ